MTEVAEQFTEEQAGETARQLSNAALAAATAFPTSSTDAKSTSPVCAPSAGL